MPNVHDQIGGVTVPSYGPSSGGGIPQPISALQITETPNRRFISDDERYLLATLSTDAMLKSVYDINRNNMVDAIEWDSILNKPLILQASDIDDALEGIINAKHSHTNKLFLDTLTQASLDAKQDSIGFTPENIAHKNVPNGYVGLNNLGLIDDAYINGIRWSNIQNKPTSSIEDIDEAVDSSHNHTNLSILDKFNEASGNLVYNNINLATAIGAMRVSDYDSVGDHIAVDKARTALSVLWANIIDKPNIDQAQLEDAVDKKHSHGNKSTLDLFSKNANDELLFKGNLLMSGVMLRSTYDIDSDGIIDRANLAARVDWSGILNGPTAPIADINSAAINHHIHANKHIIDNISETLDQNRMTWKSKEIAYLEDVPTVIQNIDGVTIRNSVHLDPVNKVIDLVNDEAFPGAGKYYGTSPISNTKGYFDIPNKKEIIGSGSLIKDIDTGTISLINDKSPTERTPLSYYGTDSNNNIGWLKFADITLPHNIYASNVIEDSGHRFVTDDQLVLINALGTSQPQDPNNPTPPVINIPGTTIPRAYTLPIRHTIISALPNFMTLFNTNSLRVRVTAEKPIIASISKDKENEIYKTITSNSEITNLPFNTTSYIYYEFDKTDDYNPELKYTNIVPIYSSIEPVSSIVNQFWFNTDSYTMFKYNGTAFIQTDNPILFIGEVRSHNINFTLTQYAFKGFYDSGWYTVDYGCSYIMPHRMGTDNIIVTAYRGKDNINRGCFVNAAYDIGSSITMIGDKVSTIDNNTVTTTRYTIDPYGSDASYDGTNQHRIIVKRAW